MSRLPSQTSEEVRLSEARRSSVVGRVIWPKFSRRGELRQNVSPSEPDVKRTLSADVGLCSFAACLIRGGATSRATPPALHPCD